MRMRRGCIYLWESIRYLASVRTLLKGIEKTVSKWVKANKVNSIPLNTEGSWLDWVGTWPGSGISGASCPCSPSPRVPPAGPPAVAEGDVQSFVVSGQSAGGQCPSVLRKRGIPLRVQCVGNAGSVDP